MQPIDTAPAAANAPARTNLYLVLKREMERDGAPPATPLEHVGRYGEPWREGTKPGLSIPADAHLLVKLPMPERIAVVVERGRRSLACINAMEDVADPQALVDAAFAAAKAYDAHQDHPMPRDLLHALSRLADAVKPQDGER